MNEAAFWWTIAATILGGAQLFVQKILAHERRDSAFAGVLMYAGSLIPAFVILIFFEPLPREWLVICLLGFAAGAVHGTGNFIRIEALKYIDSVVYFPINKVLGPLTVVIGGVLYFGDRLTAWEYVGIALSLCVPLLLLSAAEHHRQRNLKTGLWFVCISTLLTSISLLLTKEGLLLSSNIWLIFATAQIAGTVSSTLIFIRKNGFKMLHLDARDWYLGGLLGFLGFFSYGALLIALQTGLISLVYVIHAHYILIPIALSVWWYKEHINVRKVAAIIVSLLAISILYHA